MPNPTSSSLRLVPDFRVLINGTSLPPAAANDLISAKVYQDVNEAGMFALKLINWDMTRLSVTWSDDNLMAIGSQVEIQIGYVDNLQKVISGEITGLEPEFSANEIPTLTVRGFDYRHRLLRGKKSRSFTQMKDSDIASQVASEAGLTATVEDTNVQLEHVYQHNQTDMEFLQGRAARIGYELGIADHNLLFRSPDNSSSAVLAMTLSDDLLEFYPRLSSLTQAAQVQVKGWDIKSKQMFEGKAQAGDENSQMGGSTSGPSSVKKAFGNSSQVALDRPAFDANEASRMATGKLNEMALEYINADGVCMGNPDLQAGTVIKLDGLGKTFSGLYYVTSAVHAYTTRRGYITDFTVRRNAT